MACDGQRLPTLRSPIPSKARRDLDLGRRRWRSHLQPNDSRRRSWSRLAARPSQSCQRESLSAPPATRNRKGTYHQPRTTRPRHWCRWSLLVRCEATDSPKPRRSQHSDLPIHRLPRRATSRRSSLSNALNETRFRCGSQMRSSELNGKLGPRPVNESRNNLRSGSIKQSL